MHVHFSERNLRIFHIGNVQAIAHNDKNHKETQIKISESDEKVLGAVITIARNKLL